MQTGSSLTRWFVWCCDHLPLTVTRDYSESKNGVRRTGAYYIEKGTTLCHIFWATLWVPLLAVGVLTLAFGLFIAMHVVLYEEPTNHMGIFGAFVVEELMLGVVLLAALVILGCMGLSKVGFMNLLWIYLRGLKSRICPLVKFEVEP